MPDVSPTYKSVSPWSQLTDSQKTFIGSIVKRAREGMMIRIYYTPKVTTGKPVYRTILPYSVRVRNIHVRGYDNPPQPTVVLFGWDPYDKDGKTIKMFVVDRIKNAIIGKRKLRNYPDWPIEFEPNSDESLNGIAFIDDLILREVTMAAAAGGYAMPLGAEPYWKKRKKKKKRASS